MKIKLLIGTLVFLIVLNLATIGSFVYMQWSRSRDHASIVSRAPEVARRARTGRNVDRQMRMHGEMRKQLRGFLVELRTETQELERRARTMERQSFELMQRDPVPRDSLDSLLLEISAVRLEISRKAAEKLIEASAHLTPEDQKLFYQAVLTAGELRGPRHVKPGPHPPDHSPRRQGRSERRRQDAP